MTVRWLFWESVMIKDTALAVSLGPPPYEYQHSSMKRKRCKVKSVIKIWPFT